MKPQIVFNEATQKWELQSPELEFADDDVFIAVAANRQFDVLPTQDAAEAWLKEHGGGKLYWITHYLHKGEEILPKSTFLKEVLVSA